MNAKRAAIVAVAVVGSALIAWAAFVPINAFRMESYLSARYGENFTVASYRGSGPLGMPGDGDSMVVYPGNERDRTFEVTMSRQNPLVHLGDFDGPGPGISDTRTRSEWARALRVTYLPIARRELGDDVDVAVTFGPGFPGVVGKDSYRTDPAETLREAARKNPGADTSPEVWVVVPRQGTVDDASHSVALSKALADAGWLTPVLRVGFVENKADIPAGFGITTPALGDKWRERGVSEGLTGFWSLRPWGTRGFSDDAAALFQSMKTTEKPGP